jgi:hypothetical protein
LDGISSLQFNLLPQDIGARIIIPKVITRQMGQDGGDPSSDGPVARPKGSVPDRLGALEVAIGLTAKRLLQVVTGIFLLAEVVELVLF